MGLLDTFIQSIQDLNPEWTKDRLKTAGGLLADFTPVVGDVKAGYDMVDSARQGNYGEAALNGLGLLPFVPAMGGMVKQFSRLEDAQKAMLDLQKARDAASEAFKANKTRENLRKVGSLDNELADIQSAIKQLTPKIDESSDAYRGLHQAPMKDSGAPLHDLTKVYPDDIYSGMASQYYGHYGANSPLDRQAIAVMQSVKNRPTAQVKMYRAVPKDAPNGINNGDWVTTVRSYAKEHGEGALNGDYKILSKTVPAKKLFTNGDSILEFGYDESGKIVPMMLPAVGGAGLLGAYGASEYNK